MLSLSVVEEIDRLLKEGELSQRKIAARLGVSRGTVSAIASGHRGLYGKEPDSHNDDPLHHDSPPERCPRCGFFVYMPCLVCRARAYRRRRRSEMRHGVQLQRVTPSSLDSITRPQPRARRSSPSARVA